MCQKFWNKHPVTVCQQLAYVSFWLCGHWSIVVWSLKYCCDVLNTSVKDSTYVENCLGLQFLTYIEWCQMHNLAACSSFLFLRHQYQFLLSQGVYNFWKYLDLLEFLIPAWNTGNLLEFNWSCWKFLSDRMTTKESSHLKNLAPVQFFGRWWWWLHVFLIMVMFTW